MDIRNVNSGSNLSPDRLRSEPNQIDRVEEASPVENDTDEASSSIPQDRVELSDAGQMASVDLAADDVMELRMARRAMYDIPPISSDRVQELRDRIGTGYYSQPEQIKETARGMVAELFGMPPEGPGMDA